MSLDNCIGLCTDCEFILLFLLRCKGTPFPTFRAILYSPRKTFFCTTKVGRRIRSHVRYSDTVVRRRLAKDLQINTAALDIQSVSTECDIIISTRSPIHTILRARIMVFKYFLFSLRQIRLIKILALITSLKMSCLVHELSMRSPIVHTCISHIGSILYLSRPLPQTCINRGALAQLRESPPANVNTIIFLVMVSNRKG